MSGDLSQLFTNPYIIKILKQRGITSIKRYQKFETPKLPDPLQIFPQQTLKAFWQLLTKHKNNKIVIYGDYDADGVISTFLMYDILSTLLKHKHVHNYLPNRYKEGYGLTETALKNIIGLAPKLVILVDNGITSLKGVEALRKSGIDVIIIDHHTPSETLPLANVIIHPTLSKLYPQETPASVLVFLLSIYIANKVQKPSYPAKHIDLAGLSIITDVMPLVGINRFIIKKTLNKLRTNPYPVLSKIREKSGYTHNDLFLLSHVIGPRFNAPGRIDTPNTIFNLLINEEAEGVEESINTLEEVNSLRQQITKNIIERYLPTIDQNSPILILTISDELPHAEGVIGLVAAQLVKQYNKPALVFTKSGSIYKGSGRSPKHFNLIKLLRHVKEYFESVGGHKQAAGFSIKGENLTPLETKVKELLNDNTTQYKINVQNDTIKIDKHSNFSLIFEAVSSLQPFGTGFSYPRFVITPPYGKFYNDKSQKHLFIEFTDSTKIAIWNATENIKEKISNLILYGKLKRELFAGKSSYLFVVDSVSSVNL